MRRVQKANVSKLSRSWVCPSCYNQARHIAFRSNSTFTASSKPLHTSLCKPPIRHLQNKSARSRISNLPSQPARTRFAPSPTGYLHLGSLRTALFNYLLAKRTGGQFILRIEDTDSKRTVQDAEQRLFNDLRWVGLEWDEGPQIGGPCGPYRQSERSDLYKQYADKLHEVGAVYRCFCSSSRLNKLKEERNKLGLAVEYDRTCAGLSKAQSDERADSGESHVYRLRVPEVYPEFDDLVYGRIGKGSAPSRRHDDLYEDPILLKSDGLPTYHLANVIDDHLMDISHVIRGTEWLQATTKHIMMYDALGWKAPQFAHVGLLTNEQGQKLSKRHMDTDISYFRNVQEILPEALTNFAVLLGWSHNEKSDVLPLERLKQIFTLKFTKGNTVVNIEKLRYLQARHQLLAAKANKLDQMVDRVYQQFQPFNQVQIASGTALDFLQTPESAKSYIQSIIKADVKNYTTGKEFFERNIHFFQKTMLVPMDDTDEQILLNTIRTLKSVSSEEWQSGQLEAIMKSATFLHAVLGVADNDSSNIDKPMVAKAWHALRRVLMNGQDGMGVIHAMSILGKNESLRRLGARGNM
jgi:glutamyl-tRNA synthetase